MADTSNLSVYLKDLADAIREKKSTEEQIPAANFDTEIRSIETGSDIDTSEITTYAQDVKVGKVFLTNEGTFARGSFPDISYESTISTDSVEFIQTSRTINDVALTAFFNEKLFYWDNGKLNCNILNITQDIYSIDTEQQDVSYIDVGCKNIFSNNSVLIALSSNQLVSLYLYDEEKNEFSFVKNLEFTELNSGGYSIDYPTCSLAPSTPYMTISYGKVYNSMNSIAKLYEISNSYDLTFKMDLPGNTVSNRYYFRCFAGWFSDVFISQSDDANIEMPDGLNTLSPDEFNTSYLKNGNTSFTRMSDVLGVDISNSYAIKRNRNNNRYDIYRIIESGGEYSLGEIVYEIPVLSSNYSKATIEGNLVIVINGDSNNKTLEVYRLGDTLEKMGIAKNAVGLRTTFKYHSFIVYGENLCVLKSSNSEIINKMSYMGKEYIDTSDADATVTDIASGKTAYVDGEKIIGTMSNNGELNYTPSTEEQAIPAGYTSGGTVAGDSNLVANNIRLGTTIFGVEGNLEADKPDQTKTATPTTEEQVITPDTGYELASVTVNAVTSNIDSNIVAENIKKDVSILGITGTLESGDGIKTYTSETEMNNDIANISEGEVVKVITIPAVSTITVNNNTFTLGAYFNNKKFVAYETTHGQYPYGCIVGTGEFTIFPTETSGKFNAKCIDTTKYVTYNNSASGNLYTTADGSGIYSLYKNNTDVYHFNNSNIAYANFDVYNEDGDLIYENTDKIITFYLKETTMKKLIKEEDTISPTEAEQAETIISDLFGEEE